MTTTPKTPKTRRWMKSVQATAAKESVALPFQRGAKRRPATLREAQPARSSSIAAH